ncbi:hypothetical protein HDU96_010767 [Phlyctochytrium bullatum]|nr:hypothetical protein HDU96_010767 [Phlyctochytrium bullatum]
MSSVANAPDSTNIPIEQLAQEARKDEKKSIFPPVPIAVLITFIVLVALGAVAAPLGAILGTTSQNSVNTLSNTVINQAADLIFVQVQDKLLQPKRMLQVLLQDNTLERAMLTNFNNLRNETALYTLMNNMILTEDFLSGVSCVTYPNIFGRSPDGPYGPNLTFVSGYRLDGEIWSFWMDWSTNGILLKALYNPDSGNWDKGVTAAYNFPWNFVLLNTAFTQYMFTNPNLTTPWYSWTYNYGVAVASVSQLRKIPRISQRVPSLSCSFGFETEAATGKLFRDLKVTPNSKLFMIEAISESMLGNSVPNTLYWVNETDPLKTVTQWNVSTTNDTLVRSIGSQIKSFYGGSFTGIPRKNSSNLIEITVNGERWFANTVNPSPHPLLTIFQRFLNEPDNWLLIVAIPRKDFFGDIDEANRRVIAICVSVAIVGVALVAVISYLALLPLSKLIKAMESLTKLDFSALEGNILNDRSNVLEVRKLQITFAIMCKAFASGIRKNKALVTGNAGTKTSSHVPSTVNTSQGFLTQTGTQPSKD